MARNKAAAAENPSHPEPQDGAGQAADSSPPPPAGDAAVPATADAGKAAGSKWATRFSSWADHEAGVHLTEDRQNRRMTIGFDEKPAEAVRKLLKQEYGYKFDGEDQLWYKRINPAKARQGRDEAEELAFKAANLIRQEKGLEPKKAFSLGM
jgi:hypothetical protein